MLYSILAEQWFAMIKPDYSNLYANITHPSSPGRSWFLWNLGDLVAFLEPYCHFELRSHGYCKKKEEYIK